MALLTFDSRLQVSGHPRNNPMTDKTFLEVLKLDESGGWTVVATDASWETL